MWNLRISHPFFTKLHVLWVTDVIKIIVFYQLNDIALRGRVYVEILHTAKLRHHLLIFLK